MLAESIRRRNKYEQIPTATANLPGEQQLGVLADITAGAGPPSEGTGQGNENTASGSPSGSLPIDENYGNSFSAPSRKKMSTVAYSDAESRDRHTTFLK